MAFVAQPAFAARLLQAYVELDGRNVFHSYYEDNGRADAATAWRYLRHAPIMVDDDVAPLQAQATNPLRAQLNGNIVVKMQHVDRVIAQAHVSRLTMRRSDQRSQAWFLPEAEVERTALIAGLSAPKSSRQLDLPAMFVLSSLALIGALSAMAFRRGRIRKSE